MKIQIDSNNYIVPEDSNSFRWIVEIPSQELPKTEIHEVLKFENGQIVKTLSPNYKKIYSKIDGTLKYIPSDKTIEDDFTEIERPTPEHKFFENSWKLEIEIREIVYLQKYNSINANIEKKITTQFYSDVTGANLHYDTALTDQFEIDQLERTGLDFEIKATGIDGIKKRYFHTSAQIKNLKLQFFQFIYQTKLVGDTKKQNLFTNYKTISLEELQNFDEGI